MKRIIFIQGFFVLLLLNGTLQSDFLGQPSQFPTLPASPSSSELQRSPDFGRPAGPSIGIPPTQIGIPNSQESNPLSNQEDFLNAKYEPEENNKNMLGLIALYIFGPLVGLSLLVTCSLVCLHILGCACNLFSYFECARPCTEPSLRCIKGCIGCHESCLGGIDKVFTCCCKGFMPLAHAVHYQEIAQHNASLLQNPSTPQDNAMNMQNQYQPAPQLNPVPIQNQPVPQFDAMTLQNQQAPQLNAVPMQNQPAPNMLMN